MSLETEVILFHLLHMGGILQEKPTWSVLVMCWATTCALAFILQSLNPHQSNFIYIAPFIQATVVQGAGGINTILLKDIPSFKCLDDGGGEH